MSRSRRKDKRSISRSNSPAASKKRRYSLLDAEDSLSKSGKERREDTNYSNEVMEQLKQSISDDDTDIRKKSKKEKKKKKKKKSADSSSDSEASDNSKAKKKKKKKKKSADSSTDSEASDDSRAKKRKKKEKKSKKSKKSKKDPKEQLEELTASIAELEKKAHMAPELVAELEKRAQMTPMTKEAWEKQKTSVRKEFDEDTGRMRLVRGTGEIMEECVSKERMKEINRQATKADGDSFQREIKNRLEV